METDGSKPNKLLHLESLRGIAAFIVVLTHFAGAFFPATLAGASEAIHTPIDTWFYGTPLSIIFGGNFAVCLFFVLSGFVLTYGFFKSGRIEILSRSAIKRYFRLMPPVLISLLVTYVALRLGLSSHQEVATLTGSSWLASLWHLPPNLLDVIYQGTYEAFFVGSNNNTSYNPVLWTMTIEFAGSMLVFGMAAVLRAQPLRWIVYAVLIAANWQNYYLGFILGLILADVASKQALWARVRQLKWSAWLPILGVGLLLGGYPTVGFKAGTMYEFLPLPLGSASQAVTIWHTLGAVLVVLAVVAWGRLGRVLNWRPLVELGRQSFSLYLTHIVVIGTFSSYLFKSAMLSHGYLVSFAVTFAVSLPLIFMVSSLFTRWVDQPSIALAQMVLRLKLRKPAPVKVPAPEVVATT